MTLDEAIKHAEEVADLCEYEASKYDMSDSYESHVACQEGKCAEEHRQLAEWLRDYKRLLEQGACEDAISRQVLLKKVFLLKDFEYDTEIGNFVSEEDILTAPPVQPKAKRIAQNFLLDKIRAEIEADGAYEQEVNGKTDFLKGITHCLDIIDKYKAESE